MGARTPLVPVQLVQDSFINQGAGSAVDATDGNTVADPGPNHLILVVKNGDTAAHTVTVRASGNGNDASGNPQSTPPQNTVFTQATMGDLVEQIPAGDTYVSPPLTTDRFTQPDGSLSLDFDAATDITVWLLKLPSSRLGGPAL